MEYRAKLSYLRIAPRKTRLVADLIRGKSANFARDQLSFSTKRATEPLLKLLNSAISNAKNLNENVNEDDLYIKTITVDEGPRYKRFRPVARGQVHETQKRTSHITLILAERESKKSQSQNHKSQTKPKSKKTKQKSKINS